MTATIHPIAPVQRRTADAQAAFVARAEALYVPFGAYVRRRLDMGGTPAGIMSAIVDTLEADEAR